MKDRNVTSERQESVKERAIRLPGTVLESSSG